MAHDCGGVNCSNVIHRAKARAQRLEEEGFFSSIMVEDCVSSIKELSSRLTDTTMLYDRKQEENKALREELKLKEDAFLRLQFQAWSVQQELDDVRRTQAPLEMRYDTVDNGGDPSIGEHSEMTRTNTADKATQTMTESNHASSSSADYTSTEWRKWYRKDVDV